MSTAYFSGDSRYYVVLAASRSGFIIYGSLTAYFTGGTGAWNSDGSGTAWGSHIAGPEGSGTWTYDFRNASAVTVWQGSNVAPSPGTYMVGGWATMADGKGSAYPANLWISVPPNPPAAPSTPTVTQVSDTSTTVAWNRNATTAAPYSSQQVQRKERTPLGLWSDWAAVATVSTAYSNTGSHSITDSTVSNREYRYRIKASNSAAENLSAESASIFTTPAAPATLVAEKQASGSIDISLTQAVTFQAYQTVLKYSMNGGTSWNALTTLGSGVLSYNWATPPAGSSVVLSATVKVNSAGSQGHGLVSAGTLSNVVPLTAPPNAPSSLSPNGTTFNGASASEFKWNHNTVDSSNQTAYELRYREVGVTPWTTAGKKTSTVQGATLPAGTFTNGKSYQWEVRTWGVHADPSPYSPTATFQASAPPSVAVISPGAVLGAALVTVVWTFYDPEGSAQSLWEASLMQGGNQLEFQSGSGAVFSVPFATRLSDATQYQVQVRGRDGAGMWSAWDQQTFTTSFPMPAVPAIAVAWNVELGSASVTISNPTVAGKPAVIENWILRSVDNGATWDRVDTAPVNGTGFDKTVPLGIPNVLYKVVAWSNLPSSSESVAKAISTVSDRGYWSARLPNDVVLQMHINQGAAPKIDVTTGSHVKTLHWFAGRTRPVETVGEASLVTGSVEFVVPSVQQRDTAREMALMPAPHLFRLPDGTTLYCSIGPITDVRLADGWYKLTFAVTEVDK